MSRRRQVWRMQVDEYPAEDPCPHDCAVGIDAAPIRDSAKVWRCTSCGETINGRKDA